MSTHFSNTFESIFSAKNMPVVLKVVPCKKDFPENSKIIFYQFFIKMLDWTNFTIFGKFVLNPVKLENLIFRTVFTKNFLVCLLEFVDG